MISRYRELFRVQVIHEYHQGGICREVAFVVSGDAAGLLRRSGMLARTSAGLLTVLAPTPTGALARLEGETLRFGIRVADPRFANFTALDHDPHQEILLYRNDPADPAELARTRARLDDPEAWGARILAVVEIQLTSAIFETPHGWTLPFAARAEALHYHVVATGFAPRELEQLHIRDLGFAEDGRAELKFEVVTDPSPDSTAGILTADGTNMVSFRSVAVVPRSAKSMRKLQLGRNGVVVVPNLPQPGPENPRAEVIIHLAKP
jgi:hypothetical protein